MSGRIVTVMIAFSALVCWYAGTPQELAAESPQGTVDYNRDIRPILSKNCFSCHGSDEGKRSGNLRLDVREAAVAPRKERPPAIVPGKADQSELVRRITSEDDAERMPPQEHGEKLSSAQAKTLKEWINQGAVYAPHWAFIKPLRPPLPGVKQSTWTRNAIDRFILAKLEQAGLAPSPEADRYQLLRRLSLDLRGLPPSMEEINDFAKDDSPGAYEKLVDAFLADPAYGERWARVWLDLARYADSAGLGSDPLRTNMWRYRDWVIEAFNQNKPYDQFTIEQLAGDLAPKPTLDQRIATAFHRNTMTNTEGGTDDEEFRVAAVKDRANTTMQVWMGLTMGCAQCHSHKYDPISHRDYYQFYAIFNQTRDNDQPDEAPTMPAPTAEQTLLNQKIDAQVAVLKKKLDLSTPELLAAQKAWEESLHTKSDWIPLAPTEMKSDQGAILVSQKDGTIQVEGPRPANDIYTLTARIQHRLITGVRLETIPSATLPLYSAGRAPDGNFILSRFSATLSPVDQAKVKGKYVRIALPGSSRILSLAEVEVFSGESNVARSGKAAQSSVQFDGVAARAIDGKTEGDYYKAHSVTHTAGEENPWWEVELAGETEIDRVVVWNRTDNVGDRLQGAKLQVYNLRHDLIWEQTLQQIPKPSLQIALTGQPIEFKAAFADHSHPDFSVGSTLKPKDLKASGWSVAPQVGQPHVATFVPAQRLALTDDMLLTIKLEHLHGQPYFTLGQFRLSLATDPKLALRAALPVEVLRLVDRPAEKRSPSDQESLSGYYRTVAPLLQFERDELAKLEKSRPKISNLPVMEELPTDKRRQTALMVKGNFLSPGVTVSPSLPTSFQLGAMPTIGKPASSAQGEGQQKETQNPLPTRMDVARWLVHPDNPLTARVAVNRLWSGLFGRGLVETEEDFGTQGELPSHPELLDWLALEYQQTLKWDTKALVKLIVTSATYRQSSKVTPELLQRDPRNVLLSRGARYRLEAEMIRDQALCLSGLLSKKVGGPSVYPPQPDGLWQAAFNGERTWSTSKGEDRYRRGLYTFWRRTIPYPSMTAFDAPSRELCQVKRIKSNTPVQAFVTLNDPVFVEAAQALARRMVKEGGPSAQEKIRYGLKLCLTRPADEKQVAPLLALYVQELEKFKKDVKLAEKMATEPLGQLPKEMKVEELAAWTVIANVLLNLDGVMVKG